MTGRKLVIILIVLNVALLGVVGVQQLLLQNGKHQNRPASWLAAAEAREVLESSLGNDPTDSPIVAAAVAASPAVVAVGGTVSRVSYAVHPFFEDFYFPYNPRAREQRYEMPFLGSGTLIDREGHFVTNVHVIEKMEDPFITLSDGRRVEAELLDQDNRVDIAVLKADLRNTPFARMGDSEELVPGQWVIAIGNPFAQEIPDPRPTVTVGVVSALHRNYKAGEIDRQRIYLDMIQTDAAINPGNSGGPLINIRGEIIGINTFIVSRTGGSVGIGFAIPINRVHQVVDEILQHGRLRNYQMDFDVVTVTPRVARWLRVPPDVEGAAVNVIREPDGAAVEAGLEVGDVIQQADRLPIKSRSDLLNYFLSLTVGTEIEFKVLRDGKTATLNYVIEEYNPSGSRQ